MTHDEGAAATLIIDGRCGFCAWSADRLRWLDRRGRVRIVAAQSPGVLERYALTADQVAASVWFVPGGEPPRSGALAVGFALDAALGLRLAAPIAGSRILGPALERAYRWVAKNRRHLPGATPWCERPGARCDGS